jgi:hypothetical protein
MSSRDALDLALGLVAAIADSSIGPWLLSSLSLRILRGATYMLEGWVSRMLLLGAQVHGVQDRSCALNKAISNGTDNRRMSPEKVRYVRTSGGAARSRQDVSKGKQGVPEQDVEGRLGVAFNPSARTRRRRQLA